MMESDTGTTLPCYYYYYYVVAVCSTYYLFDRATGNHRSCKSTESVFLSIKRLKPKRSREKRALPDICVSFPVVALVASCKATVNV